MVQGLVNTSTPPKVANFTKHKYPFPPALYHNLSIYNFHSQKLKSNSMAMADSEFRCFVGGLAWATTDQTLEQAFCQFGDVIDSKIINDRETGRSRGFGFVTFKDEQSMRYAIEGMNGQDLNGRSITVNEAQSRGGGGGGGSSRGPRRDGGGGGGYGRREGGYGRREGGYGPYGSGRGGGGGRGFSRNGGDSDVSWRH